MESSSSRGKLIVVCGLPGSGKTTHAKALEARLNGVRFSADEWLEALAINLWDEQARARIEALQWQLAQQLLAHGHTVIIEWGTWGRSERDELRLGARKVGATVELHCLTAPMDVLFARVQQRRMEDPPIKREDLKRWLGQFQEPTAEEMSLFDEHVIVEPV